MRIKRAKLPLRLKADNSFNVAVEHFVIWCGLASIGRYLPVLRRSKVIHGFIQDGKTTVWFCRYGFINDASIYDSW